MKTIKDILKTKGTTIWSISPDASVFDALTLMAEKNAGAVIVMEAGKLVGILSERDYARKVIIKGKTSKKTKVREIMTEKVLYVSSSQKVEDCMALMTEKRIRHLPVLENETLIGVISIGDVVKAVISDQKNVIDQLEKYITSG